MYPFLYADIQCLLGNDGETLKKSSALFILKFKEQRRVTQVAVDDIIDGYRNFFELSLQCMRARIRAKLATEGLVLTLCDDVFKDFFFTLNLQ